MPPDEISLNTYQSPNKINPNSKPNYQDWVEIRNAFRYDPDDPPKAKLVPYFTPEDKNYYSDCFEFGYVFVGFAALMAISIIAYIVQRFFFGGCQGPKNKKNMADDDKMKWILIIIGCVVALGGMITMLIFSKKQ
ncbi:MAG: hypothetical protein MJ252_22995 [archaeon]|nr:hypothetical protein [archaeon]